MELHRVRFVAHQPSSIQHASAASNKIAISRSNSTIEIYTCPLPQPDITNMPWLLTSQTQVRNASIEGLTLISESQLSNSSDIRLFVAYLDGMLVEYTQDLLEKQHLDLGVGITCMDVKDRLIALGCADGLVRVYRIGVIVGEPLEFVKMFAVGVNNPATDRVLSVALSGAASPAGRAVVCGCSDGMIRMYSVVSGRCVGRMAVSPMANSNGRQGKFRAPSSDAKSQKEVFVWKVLFFNDGLTFASGDSLGHVKIWNANTCTLLHSFKTHEADVLSLCCNSTSTELYASGIDPKIVDIKLDAKTQQWNVFNNRRFNTHDVLSLTMATWYLPDQSTAAAMALDDARKKRKHSRDGNDSDSDSDDDEIEPQESLKPENKREWLVAGGIDALLTALHNPSRNFESSTIQPSRLTHFPRDLVSMCGRNLMSRVDETISIYKMGASASLSPVPSLVNTPPNSPAQGARQEAGDQLPGSTSMLPIAQESKLLFKLKLKNKVVTCAMSESVIYASTLLSNHLFQYHADGMVDFSLLLKNLPPAYLSCVADDSFLVVLARDDCLYRIALSPEQWSDGELAVQKVAIPTSGPFSSIASCGRYVALSSSRDIYTCDVDSMKLSRVPYAPLSAEERDTVNVSLICYQGRTLLFLCGKTIVVWDVEQARFNQEFTAFLTPVSKRRDVVVGVECVQDKLVLWCRSWLAWASLSDLSSGASSEMQADSDSADGKFTFLQNFQNLLHFGFFGSAEKLVEAVAVERPWSMITEAMPPAFAYKKYGHN